MPKSALTTTRPSGTPITEYCPKASAVVVALYEPETISTRAPPLGAPLLVTTPETEPIPWARTSMLTIWPSDSMDPVAIPVRPERGSSASSRKEPEGTKVNSNPPGGSLEDAVTWPRSRPPTTSFTPPKGMGVPSGMRNRPRMTPVVVTRTSASTVDTPVGMVRELRPPRPEGSRTSIEIGPSNTPGNSIDP